MTPQYDIIKEALRQHPYMIGFILAVVGDSVIQMLLVGLALWIGLS